MVLQVVLTVLLTVVSAAVSLPSDLQTFKPLFDVLTVLLIVVLTEGGINGFKEVVSLVLLAEVLTDLLTVLPLSDTTSSDLQWLKRCSDVLTVLLHEVLTVVLQPSGTR